MVAINPLLEDLSKLKDTEIENKIQDLSKKYWLVHNSDVKMQIAQLLDIFKEELNVRRAKTWQDQFEKRNKDLDNLIQVN